MLSQLSQIFEFSPNPFSILFLTIICLTIILLIVAIFSPATTTFLRKIKILEPKEKPQTFLAWIVAMILIIRIFQVFFLQLFLVSGLSMYPTFHDNDFLIVNKMSYRSKEPTRGDVIVFKYLKEDDPSNGKYFIKRMIALPGERITIKNGETTIYKQDGSQQVLDEQFIADRSTPFTCDYRDVTLGADEYFVMGDNRPNSSDSRCWGPIHKSQISGNVIFEFWSSPGVNPGKINYNK